MKKKRNFLKDLFSVLGVYFLSMFLVFGAIGGSVPNDSEGQTRFYFMSTIIMLVIYGTYENGKNTKITERDIDEI